MQPTDSRHSAAIIVAAGRGTRLGDANKILVPLRGEPLLNYSVETAQATATIHEIIIVAGLHTKSRIERIVAESRWSKVTHVALGGERRQDSVEAGLRLVSSDAHIVVIHDAARPFATCNLFETCIEAAERTGGAIAAVPITDTLKRAQAGLIVETVPREAMWAAQTPQAFQTAALRTSFAFAHAHSIDVTDEAALFELQGLPVEIVPGTQRNMKVTRPEDLLLAELLLESLSTGRRS
jgi:2-C-methyl-D-erythritol 4-phosphate cytidylyltransferase